MAQGRGEKQKSRKQSDSSDRRPAAFFHTPMYTRAEEVG